MKKSEVRGLIREAITERAIAKKVATVNKYIKKHLKDDIYALEPDSTWESAYEFKPVEVKGKYVYFQWVEPMGGNGSKTKKFKERYNITNEMHEDDIKHMLSWVVRSIKRGYKSEGESVPKF